MPLFSESQDKIYADIMAEVLGNTNISRSSAGAKMRALVEATSRKLGRMWTQFDINMGQAFLEGAEGRWLSYIGDMMGIQRLNEEPASISSLDRNLRFYVDAGTFGNINGSQSINLPAGTYVGTGEAGTGITYRTIVATVLLSTQREAYIAVQSIRSGSSVNVGTGRLRYHNFTGYSDYVNDTLKVINEAEIVRGQDPESDINYRYRIANQITSLERANEVAIRLAALSVPGVADLSAIAYYRGIGTYDLIIKSTTPNIGQGLIASVEEATRDVTSYGVVHSVRGPVEIGLSLTGSLTLKRKVPADEQTSIIDLATANIVDYVNNLDIAEEFVINEAVERAMSTSDTIKTVGISTKPFDSVYIYRPSRLEDNKVRSELVDDLTPKSDERIIVENRYAGATPILFRIST